jgi:hypothetical protein
LNDLIERLNNQGRKIGLIIDLTDTDRYYDYRVRFIDDKYFVFILIITKKLGCDRYGY